jgi:hypothetical protein
MVGGLMRDFWKIIAIAFLLAFSLLFVFIGIILPVLFFPTPERVWKAGNDQFMVTLGFLAPKKAIRFLNLSVLAPITFGFLLLGVVGIRFAHRQAAD